jgi:hypothetical protein
MEQIQIIKNSDLAPTLTIEEQKIVVAAKSLKVREMPKTKLHHLVTGIVTSCLIILGHSKKKFEDEERFLIEKEIVNDIFTNFSGLTFEEIRLACAMGARGEFKKKPDEVVYFSVATVYNWLKCYIADTKREAMAKQARFEQDRYIPKPPTKEELLRHEAQFINDCILAPYKHFLETGEYTFDNRGNVIYNKLDKLGVIPFSKERKLEIFERAKNRVLAKIEQYIGPDSRRKYKEIAEGKGEGHELVKSEAKDIALKEFLCELKEQEMDLEEFIQMRRSEPDENL